jgi:hypothetical protein
MERRKKEREREREKERGRGERRRERVVSERKTERLRIKRGGRGEIDGRQSTVRIRPAELNMRCVLRRKRYARPSGWMHRK